jgi:peptidoglycan/LPS O-acetylase OafA/YrhL
MNAAPAATRFRSLDTLRGAAALCVALGHFGSLGGIHAPFYRAVDFFLLLSGFVLAHGYYYESRIGFPAFVWRRWARMYPLHLITLILVLIEYEAFGKSMDRWQSLTAHLLFVQSMGFGPNYDTLNFPAWTISVEFWLNVAVFLFILAMGGRLTRRVATLLLSASVLCFLITFLRAGTLNTHFVDYKGVLNSGLVRCAGSFFVGVVLYRFYRMAPVRPAGSRLELLAIGLFGLSLFSSWPSTLVSDAFTPLIDAFAVWVFASGEGFVSTFLEKGGVFGDISFSVYLLHAPITLFLRWSHLINGSGLLDSLDFIVLVIILAFCCYRYVEFPLYKWSLKAGPGLLARMRAADMRGAPAKH